MLQVSCMRIREGTEQIIGDEQVEFRRGKRVGPTTRMQNIFSKV